LRTTITDVTIDNLPTSGPLIVDGANVVGSVPDGWWRDRAGAAARLRDRLAAAVAAGTIPAGVEVVLVVEGAARGIDGSDGVRVVAASVVPYAHDATYDILPDSDTGTYFAGGILIGSTLARGLSLEASNATAASCE